jgi:hypothetical protein
MQESKDIKTLQLQILDTEEATSDARVLTIESLASSSQVLGGSAVLLSPKMALDLAAHLIEAVKEIYEEDPNEPDQVMH